MINKQIDYKKGYTQTTAAMFNFIVQQLERYQELELDMFDDEKSKEERLTCAGQMTEVIQTLNVLRYIFANEVENNRLFESIQEYFEGSDSAKTMTERINHNMGHVIEVINNKDYLMSQFYEQFKEQDQINKEN